MTEDHQQLLEMEKRNWEFEASAHETQLKMELKIQLSNQERRHMHMIEELEAAHKKQMDDLRNQHTKTMIEAKMVKFLGLKNLLIV